MPSSGYFSTFDFSSYDARWREIHKLKILHNVANGAHKFRRLRESVFEEGARLFLSESKSWDAV
jgi:hypothetical protein